MMMIVGWRICTSNFGHSAQCVPFGPFHPIFAKRTTGTMPAAEGHSLVMKRKCYHVAPDAGRHSCLGPTTHGPRF